MSVPLQAMAIGGITLENLPRELTLDFLKRITNNFSVQPISSGAFGSVYKVTLADDKVIAVKRLAENSPVPHDKIFANEVQNTMVLEHENIVKLIAYCREAENKLVQSNGRYIIAEITETLLCYEYLPKGSLEQNIFGESGSSIGWDKRFKIIKGICEGIHFLHTLPRPVLHLGLNPQNILLDDNMSPKIADFEFSRIFDQEQTRMNTRSIVGSVGYMAPEYLYNGEISASSDIYSLGLIILEISTGEKNNSGTDQKHARKYVQRVKEDLTLDQIISEDTELEENGFDQIEACIKIGLQCVEIDQRKRPSIEEIVNKLNKLPMN